MSSQVDNIVNAYKTLAKIPSVVSGRINKAANRVTAKWSVRNLDRGKTTKFVSDYVLDEKFGVVSGSQFGTDISTELLSKVSPKETFKALIREEKDAKDVKKQYLEVWSGSHLAHSIDLTALDLHGDVYADSEFGCLDWSADESSIVYIAEKKLPKSEPYIKRKPANDDKNSEEGSGEKPVVKGEEFIYKQDWGEQLVGKCLSVIVVCRIHNENFSILAGLPDSWCPGQVRFYGNDSVLGVAWETEPRRLGLIFCTNRPSTIFKLTLDGKLTKLSDPGLSVRSPRVCDDGCIAYLQRTSGGPHHAAHSLVIVNEKNDKKFVIDSNVCKTTEGEDFFGVFSQVLPARCWSLDRNRVLFSTPQKYEIRSYVVNISTGAITDISHKSLPGSTTVVDVNNDYVLAVCSSATRANELFMARLPPNGSEATITWVRISEPIALPEKARNAELHHMDLEHKDSDDSVRKFTAMYTAPCGGVGKLPLIVSPHGGPHASFVDAYSLETAFFTMLGFAFLRVNFRGSTGCGQDSFLPGKVGVADVKDCMLATEEAVKKYPIDQSKVCLKGGSHGGFLVTHLIGQYPEYFRSCVTRNPVTDISSMFGSTDIADWCAVEAGFEFKEQGPISEEELLAMRRVSPIAHVHKVRAPTALMLGSGDKRVPFYQGLDFYRRLKANGVKARLYMYDDNHSLSSQPAEMDSLINTATWFFEHMP